MPVEEEAPHPVANHPTTPVEEEPSGNESADEADEEDLAFW
jgi:hypothetical protein